MSKHTDVNELGEFGLIDHLTTGLKNKQASTLKGIGDDAAVIKVSDDKVMVLSTDMLVEGIHFDLIYSPLKHLGYKSIVVNLSDIYAMNVIPTQVTFSLAISSKYSVEALTELYAGVKLACEMYNVDLVGGDTTSCTKGMVISVTAMGFSKPEDVVYRKGAQPGDILCTSGDLGAAYLGLQLLEREKQLYLSTPDVKPDLENEKYILERQLKPEAARHAVHYFLKTGLKPTSMIDISDGLASEMFHLCKSSQVGGYIEEAKIPLHPETEQMALKFRMDPTTCALNGGEDYELLFTIALEDLEKIRHMPGAYIIGEMTGKADGIKLHTSGGNRYDLKAQGWQHFNLNE